MVLDYLNKFKFCRAIKNKQRQNHEKLAAGKSIPLFPDCKYYLLPSAWLAKWRNYVLASGKNVSASMEPDVLDSVIDQLKCKKVAAALLCFMSLTLTAKFLALIPSLIL